MSEEERKHRVEIDWLTTAAGALAAVSSAVLLSTLGAAGTIIGAALGSVIATVGSAVYSQGLSESRERLAQAHAAARRKVGGAQAEVLRAGRDEDEPPPPSSWRDRLRALPWRRISLVAAGLFAIAVVALTAFEMIAGEPVSAITGGTNGDSGTTLSHLDPTDDTPEKVPDDQPSEAPTPTETPSGTEASPSQEPGSSPTPSLEPTPTEPLPSLTASPSP
jgi:small-conductance mechanosensitive channel